MSSFTADLTKFVNKADADMRLVVRKIALEAFTRVILKTPVDTGRARANWSVTVGKPALGTTTSATDKPGGATVAAATAAVATFDGNGSIFLTNSLPYIGTLEYGGYPNPGGDKTAGGYSKQAPAGMVRVTLEEMVAFIKRNAKK